MDKNMMFNPIDLDKPPEEKPLGIIKTWSFTTLSKAKNCMYQVFLEKGKGYRQPSGEAADRGTKIHEMAEDYVQGKIDKLPKELTKKIFPERFEWLREQYQEGKVEIEGEWGFTRDWAPCGWIDDDTWARIKLDALVHCSETSAIAIDHKTGRQWGNEVKHSKQGLVYVIGTFMKYPKLEHIETQFWYLDQGTIGCRQNYTREQAMALFPKVNKEANELTTAVHFNPNPSQSNCRWCHFGKPESKGGVPNPESDNPDQPICPYGIYKDF